MLRRHLPLRLNVPARVVMPTCVSSSSSSSVFSAARSLSSCRRTVPRTSLCPTLLATSRRSFSVAPSRVVHRSAAGARGPPMRYGQPHPSTHPHLLKEAERTPLMAVTVSGGSNLRCCDVASIADGIAVTPGITAKEYAQRRQNLMERVPPNSVVIVPSHPEMMMSYDIPYGGLFAGSNGPTKLTSLYRRTAGMPSASRPISTTSRATRNRMRSLCLVLSSSSHTFALSR